jgi:hypothetical protein
VKEAQLKHLESMRVSVTDMVHIKIEVKPEIVVLLSAIG